MFEWLISGKEKVRIACGTNNLVGTISNYYPAFQLIKIHNVLIPIECIREIEVLVPVESEAALAPVGGRSRRERSISSPVR